MEDGNKKVGTRKNIQSLTSTPKGLEYSKIPPQALDLEEAVLGAAMLEKEAVATLVEVLKPDMFYKESHQKIFAAIVDLFASSSPVDILTVTHHLRTKGELEIVGGAYFIAHLTSRLGSATNVEYHARIVAEKHIKRELIRISTEIQTDAFNEEQDTFDLLDKAESKLFTIAESNLTRGFDKMSNLIREAIRGIESASGKEGITGVPTGYHDLDKLTSGWQKQDLIILAARPGMGKTSFSLSMLRNTAVDFEKPIAIFSLEMSSVQLVNRLIAAETGISSSKLRKGDLNEAEWSLLNSKITKLSEAPIYIDDTPGLSLFDFRAKARRLKAQHNIQMIIIDYLQLMTSGKDNKGNRQEEISTISRSLKAIAKELDIPIMALSQLSRAVETRGSSKKPQLSDLRESGAIEQDADIVFFIYRPEYYGLDAEDEHTDNRGIAELLIQKHRNGATDTVRLRFINELAKFCNLDSKEYDDYMMGNNQHQSAAMINYQHNTITKPSKMNSESGFDDSLQVPF